MVPKRRRPFPKAASGLVLPPRQRPVPQSGGGHNGFKAVDAPAQMEQRPRGSQRPPPRCGQGHPLHWGKGPRRFGNPMILDSPGQGPLPFFGTPWGPLLMVWAATALGTPALLLPWGRGLGIF